MKTIHSLSWGTRTLAYFRDSNVSLWRKLIGVFAVAYAVMPLDAVPDFIPLLGWLDDVGILSAATAMVVREIRNHRPTLDGIPRPEQAPE